MAGVMAGVLGFSTHLYTMILVGFSTKTLQENTSLARKLNEEN